MNVLLKIEEYKTFETYGLTDEDVAYLEKDCFQSENYKSYEVTQLRDNKVRIKNTSFAGIIQLKTERLHFSTKVNTKLFYMLSFLRDEKAFLYDPDKHIEIEKGANFYDVLGRLFLNELEKIFEKGFYKSYIRKQENIPFLKGKLVIKKQIQNDIKKSVKFQCSYQDLTFDNVENRIILRATSLLIPLIRFNDKIKQDLIRYRQRMLDIITLDAVEPDVCDRVQLNRLNEHYATILKFAKVILRNHFVRSTAAGESIGFNFIVNMNKVYEDFLTAMIEELIEEDNELNKEYEVEKQKMFDNLVEEKNLKLKPDVIIKKRNVPNEYPLIIDAKYKINDPNSDYYQVIAYGLALKSSKSCCLIYPKSEKVKNEKLTLRGDIDSLKPREIKLYAIDINLDIANESGEEEQEIDFATYVKNIKNVLKPKLERCLTV